MLRSFLPLVILSSLAAPAPVAAREMFEPVAGTFVGLRIVRPLGQRAERRTSVALALAPTLSRVAPGSGRIDTRIGEGLALRLSPGAKPAVTLAGVRADRAFAFASRKDRDNHEQKLGLSTGAVVGIGLVTIAAVAAVVYFSQDCDHILGNNQCNGD